MRITTRVDILKEVVVRAPGPINIIVSCVDFDAVGSAIGLAGIVHFFGKEVRIFYPGAFSLRQRDFLFTNYHLDFWMQPLDQFKFSEGGNDCFALVDSSTSNDDRLGDFKDKFTPMIIIDHHGGFKIDYKGLKKFVLIDTQVGAASTLVTEVLKRLKILDNTPDFETHLIALLLSMGIHSDTHAFVAGSERDRIAYAFLQDFLPSKRDLEHLINYPVPERYFEYLQHAQNHQSVASTHVVASAGLIDSQDIHDVSRIADLLLKDVGTPSRIVVVWGAYSNEIKISIRLQECGDPEMFLKKFVKVFGKGAGGKTMPDGGISAGAVMSLGSLGFMAFDPANTNQIDLISRHLSGMVARV